MRSLLLVAVATSACYHSTSEVACQASCTAENPACPGTMACGLDFLCHGEGEADCGDAAVFVIPDVPLCLGGGVPDFVPDCPAVIPGDSVELAGGFDTDDDARCSAIDHQLDGTTACIVHAGTIHVTGAFAPTGTRPLALIAFGDLVVDGAIDVAAHAGSPAHPPGGDDPRCATSVGNDDVSGGGGGAGGSFGSSGGAGGGGDSLTLSAPPTATDAGRALRGGCPGSRGGNGTAAGHGGGAIYLVARATLTVTAAIDASGSGAPATALHGGGGGGGSGGMIVLEAATLHVGATVFADGGGASGGSAATMMGGAGADPTVATAGMGAPGGGTAASPSGQDASGPGGRGSSLAMKIGQRGVDALGVNHGAGCGGGGGGGGAGHVFVLSTHATIDPGVVVSPAES